MIKYLFKFVFIIRIMILKRKARRLSCLLNDRVYIVKFGNEVKIISRRKFKELKHKGYFPLSFTQKDLSNIALYQYHYHATYKATK
jgi:hypothetical protein